MARYKIQFWLNSEKIDELNVADTVAELKQRRSFSAVVRDGIMIVKELREGRVDLLLTLYPWVKDAIADMLPPPTPPENSNLERQIADLKSIILAQGGIGAPPPNYPSMKHSGGVLPAAAVAKAAAPMDADTIASDFLAFIQ